MFWKVAAKILKGASRGKTGKEEGDDHEDDQEKDDEDGGVNVDEDDEDDRMPSMGLKCRCN